MLSHILVVLSAAWAKIVSVKRMWNFMVKHWCKFCLRTGGGQIKEGVWIWVWSIKQLIFLTSWWIFMHRFLLQFMVEMFSFMQRNTKSSHLVIQDSFYVSKKKKKKHLQLKIAFLLWLDLLWTCVPFSTHTILRLGKPFLKCQTLSVTMGIPTTVYEPVCLSVSLCLAGFQHGLHILNSHHNYYCISDTLLF